MIQDLEPLVDQGTVAGFFNNVKNADKLSGIAGDIHDAIMDYQVWACNPPTNEANICIRHHCSKVSMIRVVNSL